MFCCCNPCCCFHIINETAAPGSAIIFPASAPPCTVIVLAANPGPAQAFARWEVTAANGMPVPVNGLNSRHAAFCMPCCDVRVRAVFGPAGASAALPDAAVFPAVPPIENAASLILKSKSSR